MPCPQTFGFEFLTNIFNSLFPAATEKISLASTSWELSSEPADIALIATVREPNSCRCSVSFTLALHPRSPSSIFYFLRDIHFQFQGANHSDGSSDEVDSDDEDDELPLWRRSRNELKPGMECTVPLCDGNIFLFGLRGPQKNGSSQFTNTVLWLTYGFRVHIWGDTCGGVRQFMIKAFLFFWRAPQSR